MKSEKIGTGDKTNVQKTSVIAQSDFTSRLTPLFQKNGFFIRKSQIVHAMQATGGEKIMTIVDNQIETINTADPGDFIITNQTSGKEQYIIKAENFHKRYEAIEKLENGDAQYASKGALIAIQLNEYVLNELGLPSRFQFIAPWGEPQIAEQGDYILANQDFSDMYRVSLSMFLETYVKV